MLYVSPSVLTSLFLSLFLRLSFSLVLLVFIVITTAVPLESSTFFSTGAINEEGLTPFSSSSSPFSSLLQVPARLLSHLLLPSSRFFSLLSSFLVSNLPSPFSSFCPTQLTFLVCFVFHVAFQFFFLLFLYTVLFSPSLSSLLMADF